MMPRSFILVLLASLTSFAAHAVTNTHDSVPAATLLLPYFEVDAPNNFPEFTGAVPSKTVFTVGNATADAVLTRVTLWSDFGIPTFSFHLYLTGFDIEEIDLKQVFDGIVPRSGSTISNRGSSSSPNVVFPGCTPTDFGERMPATDITGLRNAHSGHASSLFAGMCASRNYGDDVLRGFVTVDVVNSCDLTIQPNESQYSALLDTANAIWGRWEFINSANNFADASPLVHVEANEFPVGEFTFYGRYNNFNASDNREALGSTWATRFVSGGAFSGGTSLRVWREPRSTTVPVACSNIQPSYLPGGVNEIVAFDEQEDAVRLLLTDGVFALATQRVQVQGLDLPLPFDFGWLQLNLNSSSGSTTADFKQSFVNTVIQSEGRFSTGFDATRIAHPSTPCAGGGVSCNNLLISGEAPVFPSMEAVKSVTSSGPYTVGSTVTYQIVLSRNGPLFQQDDPASNEFFDQLDSNHSPHWVDLISAAATSGTIGVDTLTEQVTWNGTLDSFTPTVTITINAQVNGNALPGNNIRNEATVNFDANGDGTNESTGASNLVFISVSAVP